MRQLSGLLVVIALIGGLSLPVAARAAGQTEVPAALAPWVDWVLDDDDRRACALGSGGGRERVCAWPGRLALDLGAGGGRFAQHWDLQAESWVPLPGGDGAWPQQVSAGGDPLVVVEHDGRPALRLGPGTHRLTGGFIWRRRPEVLAVPAGTGLLSLRLDGADIARPRLDDRGRLWLGRRGRPEVGAPEPDTLALEVTRRIDDGIPLEVGTRLALDVAGRPREVTLGPVLLPGGIPLRVEGPLPARLLEMPAEDGAGRWMLQVQVRPGRWVLTVDSYHPGPVNALTLGRHEPPWPVREVWAFAAHPDLRQVEIGGAEPVDPRQTRLPADWQRLPAYVMHPGETLTLSQLRRGALDADRVGLVRELRLDYSADAFSVRDRLEGRLAQRSRLDALPPLSLGQVQVDGEPRFITRLDQAGTEGIEVRSGDLDLVADARIDSGPVGIAVTLPASGWALPLDSISTRLNLPPGWDLLAVAGADNLPATWLARWSLLDIFLVLVVALGIGRLWGWPWGLLALLTLVLIWQEPGAPRWVWLHVLVAAALLRLLPDAAESRSYGVLRTLLRLYYRGALLVLAVIALPFLVTQMRDGLFPQLERSGVVASARTGLATQPRPKFDFYSLLPETEVTVNAPGARSRAPQPAAPAEARPLPTLTPGALVQTGAGVPDWTWHSFELQWTGTVTPEQRLRLWLLPPLAALVLAALTLVLVPLLGLRLAGWPRPKGPARVTAGGVAVLLSVAVVLPLPGGDAIAATPSRPAGAAGVGTAIFPPPALLDDLKRRLLEPPECAPRCAEIPHLAVETSASGLQLRLTVDAAVAVALPVPGSADGWLPADLTLDGKPLPGLRRGADGVLLAPVPAGRHRLIMAGPLPAREQVDIPLPLRPRFVSVRVAAPWQIEGVDGDGRPGDQLRLLREPTAAAGAAGADAAADEPAPLPPLLRVTRTFRLGLDWTLDTGVERLSPPAAAVTLRVPLVAGEAVTTPGMQIDDDRVLVSLPPGRTRLHWASTLTPVDRLTLTAPEDPRLTEVWRLEVSPVWHIETSGVPAVHNLGPADRWLPTWRPWPGEQLLLQVSRPAGVPGPTLTLDRSIHGLTPGRRSTDTTLELDLRSSQGGRHRIELPAGAELTRFTVDGQSRPLALQGRAVDLPLVPGSQQVVLGWRAPAGLDGLYRPARIDLGIPGVNAVSTVHLGRDRWLLWTWGPRMGPAVLFWGLLVVLAMAAAVLARSRLTPLGFVSWLLLGIGLSQAPIWSAALVVLWLFGLGLRRRLGTDTPRVWFNLAQVGLVLLTLAALAALVVAVQQGLLGRPDMQVAGNGSSATELNWYQDRQGPRTESVTVVSAPIWVYRALMLAWALWLAWRLLDWLRWGWQGFAEPVLWRRKASRKDGAAGLEEEQLTVDID